MSASRSRSTAQPLSDSQPTGRSGIPVPTTIKKPANSMRMSLAGPPQRVQPMAPPPTNPRHSMMRSQNINPLLQSTSKMNVGRTPVGNRRVSTWTGAGPSAPPHSQTGKDTRPLRERSYQVKMKQEIAGFLQGADYEGLIQLSNITGKDFRAIFWFLILCLDPNFPVDPSSKFEDEFLFTLKLFRYPFVQQIDVKWLAAPASMHCLPPLLGVLHWLVELCKTNDLCLSTSHLFVDPQEIPEEFDEPGEHQALLLDYYEQSYNLWLDQAGDLVGPQQDFENRYAKKNERIQIDLEERSLELNKSLAQLKQLTSSEPPVIKQRKENELLKTDSEKFQKILQQYIGRKKKLIDTIAYENNELAADIARLEHLKVEQENLAKIIKEQNLTPDEVGRMNSDHERLSRTLQDLQRKIAEGSKLVRSLEVGVTHRVAAAEEAVDAYLNFISTIGLLPPLPAPFQDVDLTLSLNPAEANPHHLLSGPDIRKVVKPTLSSIAESKRSERALLESERIKVDNELDQLTIECENVDEEIGEVEKKVLSLNEQADDLRDAAQREASVANAEIERLGRDLVDARNAALASGIGVKTRLQALQVDYREQVERVYRLKEETVRAIIKHSHDIAMFKEDASRHLRELREFVEGN